MGTCRSYLIRGNVLLNPRHYPWYLQPPTSTRCCSTDWGPYLDGSVFEHVIRFGILIFLLTLPVCLVLPRKHPNDSGDFAKFRDGAEAKFDVRVGNAYGPEARKALAMEIPRKFNRLPGYLGIENRDAEESRGVQRMLRQVDRFGYSTQRVQIRACTR